MSFDCAQDKALRLALRQDSSNPTSASVRAKKPAIGGQASRRHSRLVTENAEREENPDAGAGLFWFLRANASAPPNPQPPAQTLPGRGRQFSGDLYFQTLLTFKHCILQYRHHHERDPYEVPSSSGAFSFILKLSALRFSPALS